MFWRVREGMHGLVGQCAPRRHAHHRGRLRPARAHRRVGRGHPGAARRARVPHRRRRATPRPETSTSCSPRLLEAADRERYDGFMGKLVELVVGKYDGSLKAEHGTGRNMAPYVEREWGEKATALMWRIKALADPDGVLTPGRAAQPRPRRPPHEPAALPRDRGRGRRQPLHRVRVLRAGLPEPRPDDDAAPADRAAPRDGAPARGVAGAPGAGRGVRLRRARHLRGRRHLHARLPAGDRHRRAGQGSARAAGTPRAPSAWRCAPPGARPPSSARRGRGCERARLAARALDEGRVARSRGRAVGSDELVPRWPTAMPRAAPGASCRRPRARAPPPSTCRRASTGSSARARRARTALAPRRGAGRGLGARGAAGVDPARRRRPLLRGAVELQGLPRGPRRDGAPHARRPAALERRGRAAVVTDASSCALGLGQEMAEALDGEAAERHASSRSTTPSRGRTTACSPRSMSRARSAGHGAPDLLGAPPGPGAEARARRARGSPTTSRSLRPPRAAGWPATAACCTPSSPPPPRADAATEVDGRALRRLPVVNRTCEIGLQQGTGRAYESFVFALEAATRPTVA